MVKSPRDEADNQERERLLDQHRQTEQDEAAAHQRQRRAADAEYREQHPLAQHQQETLSQWANEIIAHRGGSTNPRLASLDRKGLVEALSGVHGDERKQAAFAELRAADQARGTGEGKKR